MLFAAFIASRPQGLRRFSGKALVDVAGSHIEQQEKPMNKRRADNFIGDLGDLRDFPRGKIIVAWIASAPEIDPATTKSW